MYVCKDAMLPRSNDTINPTATVIANIATPANHVLDRFVDFTTSWCVCTSASDAWKPTTDSYESNDTLLLEP